MIWDSKAACQRIIRLYEAEGIMRQEMRTTVVMGMRQLNPSKSTHHGQPLGFVTTDLRLWTPDSRAVKRLISTSSNSGDYHIHIKRRRVAQKCHVIGHCALNHHDNKQVTFVHIHKSIDPDFL